MALTILITLLYLTLLALAIPPQPPIFPSSHHDYLADQFPLRPLACTIQLPTSYQQIAEDSPTTSFPQSRLFNVSQAEGGTSNIDTLVRFANIPSGSYGCELSVSFTFDYPISSSGNSLLNVYSLPKDISASDTYKTYFPNGGHGTPQGAFLFATTKITGQKAVLNSQACKSTLDYLFEIASDTKAGAVSFIDAGDNLSGIGGFYLSYDC